MEYGFIFGGAGTGKTAYIYRYLTEEALKHPEKKYVLFVPEQNTLRAQQELIACSKRHGMINLDVLSFQLLAYRVFEELGVQKPDILRVFAVVDKYRNRGRRSRSVNRGRGGQVFDTVRLHLGQHLPHS